MHPIEHLRHVARSQGASPALLASEAAGALAQVARSDAAGLVPACRRLVAAHLAAGPIWWLSARVLCAPDPARAALESAQALGSDPTPAVLAASLPEEASVLVPGWPDATGDALRRRGDLEALVLDAGGEGSELAARLERSGNRALLVPDSGVGPAAASARLVVLEALAAGPSGLLAAPGSLAAAAVASRVGVAVWGVLPVGRVLPGPLWEALLSRFDASGQEPWDRPAELVPAELVSLALRPEGLLEAEQALHDPECPVAPELLRDAG